MGVTEAVNGIKTHSKNKHSPDEKLSSFQRAGLGEEAHSASEPVTPGYTLFHAANHYAKP